jgi:hypothetical protein
MYSRNVYSTKYLQIQSPFASVRVCALALLNPIPSLFSPFSPVTSVRHSTTTARASEAKSFASGHPLDITFIPCAATSTKDPHSSFPWFCHSFSFSHLYLHLLSLVQPCIENHPGLPFSRHFTFSLESPCFCLLSPLLSLSFGFETFIVDHLWTILGVVEGIGSYWVCIYAVFFCNIFPLFVYHFIFLLLIDSALQ